MLNNTRESRAAVVAAINAISFQTGVVAINSNNDNQGVRLEAKVQGREVRGSWSDGDSAGALKGDRLAPCERPAEPDPMDILYLLIPLSVLLVFGIIGVFWWALQSGQFDNIEREGERILKSD